MASNNIIVVKIVEALACGSCGRCGEKGNGVYQLHCPAHNDEMPSLSVTEREGKVLLHCHAGCPQAAVIAELRRRDLWPGNGQGNKGGPPRRTRYEIKDAKGKLLAVHVRSDFPDGTKSFAWERPGDKKGLSGIKVEDLPLYRTEALTALQDGDGVVVAEGEKAALALAHHGVPAVGTVTGANVTPSTESLRPLTRLRVTLWPDNDQAGQAHMARVAERLAAAGKMPQTFNWEGAPEKGDACDFFASGKTREDFLALLLGNRPADGPDLGEVLDAVVVHNKQYISVSSEALDTIALWSAHSHAFRAAETTPYIRITSPMKRSGKSRVEEVQESLVARAWLTGRASAAVLPRKIDAECPTLLLDETDAAFRGAKDYAEALRGILNTGWRRGGKTSLCIGQGKDISYKDFSTFCPKMLAGIGDLPDTIADRCVAIEMKRRTREEAKGKPRFRLKRGWAEGRVLHDKLAQWASCPGVVEKLAASEPHIPEWLDERAADMWEPLLAIADMAGSDWTERARKAAKALSSNESREDDDLGVKLLSDVRDLFGKDVDRLSSEDVVAYLVKVEESPWADMRNGKSLNKTGLAAMLRPFRIRPKPLRFQDETKRGYERTSFKDAWERYLPPTPGGVTGETPKQREGKGVTGDDPVTCNNRNSNGRPPAEAGDPPVADEDEMLHVTRVQGVTDFSSHVTCVTGVTPIQDTGKGCTKTGNPKPNLTEVL